jgi:hypothetical protein
MPLVSFLISPAGRLARIAAGVVLIVVGLALVGDTAGTVLAVVGLVPIATGATNVCLIGPLFGADLRGRPRTGRGGRPEPA